MHFKCFKFKRRYFVALLCFLFFHERGSNYSNLQISEQQVLKSLKNRRDIVIKEADRGGAVVVWGREDYCKEAYGQLNDGEVYEHLSSDGSENLAEVSKLNCIDRTRLTSGEWVYKH